MRFDVVLNVDRVETVHADQDNMIDVQVLAGPSDRRRQDKRK